jgi:hypothetical protein
MKGKRLLKKLSLLIENLAVSLSLSLWNSHGERDRQILYKNSKERVNNKRKLFENLLP